MPIYFIFLIAAIIVALCSDKIDKKVNGNGKLKKIITAVCVGSVVAFSLIIKFAL